MFFSSCLLTMACSRLQQCRLRILLFAKDFVFFYVGLWRLYAG